MYTLKKEHPLTAIHRARAEIIGGISLFLSFLLPMYSRLILFNKLILKRHISGIFTLRYFNQTF